MKRLISAMIMAAMLSAVAHGQGGERAAAPSARPQGERLAPPASLDCPRNDTTSFTGRVLSYSRGRGRVRLHVRTDEETTEQFTLRYGRGGPERLFLLRGGKFSAADWPLIESRVGRLRPGVRVTVWACYEGDNPAPRLLDWRPPEK